MPSEGWVSATSENMSLHVDMTAQEDRAVPGRRSTRRLAEMKASHARLPRPGGRRPPHRDAGEGARHFERASSSIQS